MARSTGCLSRSKILISQREKVGHIRATRVYERRWPVLWRTTIAARLCYTTSHIIAVLSSTIDHCSQCVISRFQATLHRTASG